MKMLMLLVFSPAWVCTSIDLIAANIPRNRRTGIPMALAAHRICRNTAYPRRTRIGLKRQTHLNVRGSSGTESCSGAMPRLYRDACISAFLSHCTEISSCNRIFSLLRRIPAIHLWTLGDFVYRLHSMRMRVCAATTNVVAMCSPNCRRIRQL